MGSFGLSPAGLSGIDVKKLPPEKAAALLHMLREREAQKSVQTGQPFQDPIAAFLGRSPAMNRAKDAISQSPAIERANRAVGQVGGFLNRSADQMESGWSQLTGEDPAGMTAKDPEFWNRRAKGTSDVIRGSAPFLLPLAGPASAEAPVGALLGLGGGMAAGAGTEAVARKAGVPEGRAALLGDLAGMAGGAVAAEEGPAAVKEIARAYKESPLAEERGAISEKPKKTRDVKARTIEDLEQRIPQSVRVVSKDPTKTIDGKPFHSLDLDAPGEGFLPLQKYGPEMAGEMEKQAWEQAINESEIGGGTAARDAVKATGARPPGPEFWDKAMRLPKRSRFWYELSGESFTGKHFDVPREIQPRVIDAIAGTSGGVEPGPNARRGIGILAEDIQKQPVMTDLRDPASARKALSPEPLRSLKYRSFSGTMQHVSGLSPERPLSTNDVQVASTFGIKGTDIGSNPVLYEVLSRFYMKMRDMQNALLPPRSQPWETYQLQASGWVHERAVKNPAKASEYDDYALVLPGIIQELKAAGVPVPNDKITMETLRDPRTPNLTSGTREHFLKTPIGTMEVATKITPEGAAASSLHDQLKQMDQTIPWVRKARKQYEQIQRNAMSALMKRKGGNKELGIAPEPSLLSQLASEVVGQKIDVSRIDRMGYGTFEGAINPNMRVPMTGRGAKEWISLDSTEREALLSMLGQDLHQEAMVSSHFNTTLDRSQMHTYSVFLQRYDGVVDQDAITAFSNQIGFPVNVSQVPNGVLIDVNIEKYGPGQFGRQPTAQAVEDAAHATLYVDPNVKDMIFMGREYDSNYVPSEQYTEKIDAWRRTQGKAGKGPVVDKPGRAGRAGDTAQRTRNLARVRKKIQSHAKVRDAKFGKWTEDARARLAKHQGEQLK